MKTIKTLLLVLVASAMFSQAVNVTQVNPAYQTPNQWGGGQSWTALTPMYNDFVSLNNIAVGTTLNNLLVGNNTFTGTTAFTGTLTGMKATVYADSVSANVNLVSTQSGLTVILKFLAGDTITLPTTSGLSVGTVFYVKIGYSTTSVGHTINTNGSDVFYGTLFELSTSSASPFTSTANKTIHMSSTTTCGLAGGFVTFIYMSPGRWQTSGTLYGSGSVATAFKN